MRIHTPSATMQLHVASSEALLEYLRASAPSFHSAWYLGVVLSLAGSFAGALGDNLIRLSFIKEHGRSLKTTRSLHRRPLWLMGFLLSVVVNPLLTVLSLKFAAAAIVLPFGGMHIFWNVLLVGYLLRETLLPGDVYGSICILIGVCLVISYGPHEVPTYPLGSLSSLAAQPSFTLYLLAETICVILCLAASASPPSFSSSADSSSFGSSQFTSFRCYGSESAFLLARTCRSQQQLQLDSSDTEALAGAAVWDSDGSVRSNCSYPSGLPSESTSLFQSALFPPAAVAAPAADEARKTGKAAGGAAVLVEAGRLSALAFIQQRLPPWLRRFSVPVLSGMFGGLGNLSAKRLVDLLGTQDLHKYLWSSEFAVCLVSAVLFCSLQLLYLNLALLRLEAKVAVPVVNATLIASGSLGGLILFREYTNMSVTALHVFAFGILLVIAGIAILASAPSGAVAKASQPELFAQRRGETDGTDEERTALGSFYACPPTYRPDGAC